MNKTTAIQRILSGTNKQPIIFTTGYACRIAKDFADRPGNFYMVGSMGLAASVATGVALKTKLPTIVVDGDGSLLMNPGTLISIGMQLTLPLVHILLDDRCYASTGCQLTNSSSVDFTGFARAAGYSKTYKITCGSELSDALGIELANLSSPVFIHCVLNPEDAPVPPRINLDLETIHSRFNHHIRSCID